VGGRRTPKKRRLSQPWTKKSLDFQKKTRVVFHGEDGADNMTRAESGVRGSVGTGRGGERTGETPPKTGAKKGRDTRGAGGGKGGRGFTDDSLFGTITREIPLAGRGAA